jgi:hypothetical protein
MEEKECERKGIPTKEGWVRKGKWKKSYVKGKSVKERCMGKEGTIAES